MRMMRAAVAGVVVVALAMPASAATTEVTVSTSGFSPSTVAKNVGGSVTWRRSGGYHNVYSSQGMFSSGAPTNSSFTFTRTFSSGTFPYICAVHPSTMRGTVRVKPRVGSAPSGTPFTVTWATGATNTGSRFTVQYKVGSGSWRTWRSATSSLSGVFGSGNQPVRAVAGRTYRFRARSLSGDNASSYSPARAFTP